MLHDTFDDNRLNWPIGSDEKGALELADGNMRITRRQRSGRYYYRTYSPNRNQTTLPFEFEVKISPERANGFGVVLDVIRTKKGKTAQYTAFMVTPKDISIYTYYFASGQFFLRHRTRRPGINTKPHTFKVVGDAEKTMYYLDGELVFTHDTWKKSRYTDWGFLVQGYGIVNIEEMLLLGTSTPLEQ